MPELVYAGAGGLVSGLIGAGAASLVCGPVTPVCFAGVATGIVVAYGLSRAWDYYVQPIIFEQRGIVPERNLFPLN
ncbi:MAG: hypothetical protein QNJ45_20960 [Ardenticatenaceae bacterium]|nr:hypothetical protein [Ardenticatenaceae bacterium]